MALREGIANVRRHDFDLALADMVGVEIPADREQVATDIVRSRREASRMNDDTMSGGRESEIVEKRLI
jgi:hypothetical protein